MIGPDFRYVRGGLHLPALGLWLDAHDRVGADELVMVSHAHSDHTAPHARVVFTEATRQLMRARVAGQREEQVLEFGRRYSGSELGLRQADAGLTLLPAGHVLGSAMAWVEAPGGTLLYTGDFKLRPGRMAEPCQPRTADVLVMETTFGRPGYVFPPTDTVLASVVRFCREAIDHGEVPVLLGYSLGKAQEVLAALGEAGLPAMLDTAVARMTRVYEGLGRTFGPWRPWDPSTARGCVVIAPPSGDRADWPRQLGRMRVAMLTGWALDPGARFQHRVDAVFPLSDHADFPDLVEFVGRVNPRRVATLHGFAAEFASHLRTLGIEAQALGLAEQLDFSLGATLSGSRSTAGAAQSRGTGPVEAPGRTKPAGTGPLECDLGPAWAGFVLACEAAWAQPDQAGKIAVWAAYLKELPRQWLVPVVNWGAGTGSGGGGGGRSWPLFRDSLAEATGRSPEAVERIHWGQADLAETAAECLGESSVAGPGVRLSEVQSLLAGTRGTPAFRTGLAQLWRRMTGREARWLARVLQGDLRVGLTSASMAAAVAQAVEVGVAELHWASQRCGDLGHAASLAREGRVREADVRPGYPVSPHQPVPGADADALPPEGAGQWIEEWIPGVRCQVHRVGSAIRWFGSDGRELSGKYVSLRDVGTGADLGGDVVLDGVLARCGGGRWLPWVEARRPESVGVDDWFAAEVPRYVWVAFDLLWWDGRGWLDQPWEERRAALERLTLPRGWERAVGSRGREGIPVGAGRPGSRGWVIKQVASPYEPGQRSGSWRTYAPSPRG
jgi:DNA ligase-1